MKTRSVAFLAAAGLATGAACGQASLDVLVNGTTDFSGGAGYTGQFQITVVLNRNGSTDGYFNSFQAWSQFGGSLVSGVGAFAQPVEGADFSETQANDWEGRRPPAFPVPGGSGGGFRYPGANQGVGVANGGSIDGIAGIAQSAALGGFSQDTSPSIEVYRATLDVFNATGLYEVAFEASLIQVFIADFNIERAVLNNMILNAARLDFTPAPGSATALLAGAGLLTRRRHARAGLESR